MARRPTTTISEIECMNPHRQPNWRWQWAKKIVEQKLPESRWQKDPWLAVAVHLVRHKRGLCGKARGQFAWVVRAAIKARKIEFGRPELRLHVQLRLLAGQSVDLIARKLGLAPDVIHGFAALFFDIRDRLDARDWLMLAIQAAHDLSTEAGRVAAAACKLVYFFGARIIPTVRSIVTSGPLLAQPADLTTKQGKRAEWTRLCLVVLASQGTEPETGSWLDVHLLPQMRITRPNFTVRLTGIVPALEVDCGWQEVTESLQVCRRASEPANAHGKRDRRRTAVA